MFCSTDWSVIIYRLGWGGGDWGFVGSVGGHLILRWLKGAIILLSCERKNRGWIKCEVDFTKIELDTGSFRVSSVIFCLNYRVVYICQSVLIHFIGYYNLLQQVRNKITDNCLQECLEFISDGRQFHLLFPLLPRFHYEYREGAGSSRSIGHQRQFDFCHTTPIGHIRP